MPYRGVRLTPQGVGKVLSGRLWLSKKDFKDRHVLRDLSPGCLVRLLTPENHFLAVGYINPKSYIVGRVLCRKDVHIGVDFFVEQFKRSLSRRKEVYPTEECFRLVHAEGDLLPGLTIDVYQRVCVVQIATAGMECLREEILQALREILAPQAVVLRNDLPVREEEGLPLGTEILGTVRGPLKVQIDGLWYVVDPVHGQKTGFFLDQRENRRKIRRYVRDKMVYDLYCYSGAFALNAAHAGAQRILAVDRSQEALAQAEENARLNGLHHKIVFIQERVENFLENTSPAQVVILDPPAFIKHRRALKSGLLRYRQVNKLALKNILAEGVLLSASCSQFLSLSALKDLINREARAYLRSLQLLEYGMQALDHPPLMAMPETFYLKALFLRIF